MACEVTVNMHCLALTEIWPDPRDATTDLLFPFSRHVWFSFHNTKSREASGQRLSIARPTAAYARNGAGKRRIELS